MEKLLRKAAYLFATEQKTKLNVSDVRVPYAIRFCSSPGTACSVHRKTETPSIGSTVSAKGACYATVHTWHEKGWARPTCACADLFAIADVL